MTENLVYIIAAFGAITLIGVFIRMRSGFGIFNLRVVGIVLIATFATLLSLNGTESLTAGMGILGAIAGYLFGASNEKKDSGSSVSSESNSFGDNTKIAGRDINETIEKLENNISNIQKAVINQNQNIDKILPQMVLEKRDFLVNTIYERQGDLGESLKLTITSREKEGWHFISLSSDYKGMDGMFCKRPPNDTYPIKFNPLNSLLTNNKGVNNETSNTSTMARTL